MFKKNSNSKTSENYSVYDDPELNKKWDKRLKGKSTQQSTLSKFSGFRKTPSPETDEEISYENAIEGYDGSKNKEELHRIGRSVARRTGIGEQMSKSYDDIDSIIIYARQEIRKIKGGKPIATRGKKGTGKAKTAKAKKPVVKKKTTKATKKKKN